MFVLGIHYLNGWSMAAADGPHKQQAEWPPHPDRVYSALAAAWFETGEDAEEEASLRWLESLPPPSLWFTEAETRDSCVSYVPVNDVERGRTQPKSNELKSLKSAGLTLIPEFRIRQARRFPVAIPHRPKVYLLWPDADPNAHLGSLEQLATKVTHIGHSASLVQVWTNDRCELNPTLSPNENGLARLRVPTPGRLDSLAASYNRDNVLRHAELKAHIDQARGTEKRKLKQELDAVYGGVTPMSHHPLPGRWQRYSLPESDKLEVPGTVFSSRLAVLTLRGKAHSCTATLKLTSALRSALMKLSPEQPAPEWLSGHQPDGTRSLEPHLAYLSLPFVGSKHADGRVMGLALAMPRQLASSDLVKHMDALLYDENTFVPRVQHLFGADLPSCSVSLETRESPPHNLDSDTWTRPSRVWASVTPVVLNRYFAGTDRWIKSIESIKDACMHIGLPPPREVMTHPVSLVEGAPHARDFPALRNKNAGGTRPHTHVVLAFDTPVSGPIVLGAGRFRGYGLCRPMDGMIHASL